MNKRNIGRILLIIIAVASFLSAFAEGMYFYGSDFGEYRFPLIVYNALRVFTFEPQFFIDDAIEALGSSPSFFEEMFCRAYAVAVFTAPACTFTALISFIGKIFRSVFKKREHNIRHRYIVFGDNNCVSSIRDYFYEANNKKESLHIISDKEMSSETILESGRQNCFYHYIDISENPTIIRKKLKKLKVSDSECIMLLEENSVRNFALLQILEEMLKNEKEIINIKKDTKIVCRCDDDMMNRIAEEHCDININSNENCLVYEPQIVNMYELLARKMFHEYSIHSFYYKTDVLPKNWNVHLVLIGYDEFTMQSLLQAMNLGVADSENDIVIDILSENISDIFNRLFDRLSPELFDVSPDKFTMKKEFTDGFMEIRISELPESRRKFSEYTKALHMDNPFTYAVISEQNTEKAVFHASVLSELLSELKVPIIMHSTSEDELVEYIDKNNTLFAGVRVMYSNNVITLNDILNRDLNNEAVRLNYEYEKIGNSICISRQTFSSVTEDNISAKEKWNKLNTFKRKSNHASAAHKEISRKAFDMLCKNQGISVYEKLEYLFGKNGIIMKTCDNISECGDISQFIGKLKSDETAYKSAAAEHRRWCYFMASLGWSPCEAGKRNDALHRHDCILTQQKLETVKPDTCPYDLITLLFYYKELSEK